MTAPVISTTPDAPVGEVAKLLIAERISGLPVLDGERLVGVVSEGDLVRRLVPAQGRGLLAALFQTGPTMDDFLANHGTRVGDVMTAEVITASPETDAAELASTMAASGIKRLPILDAAGKLVGIVTRANLLRALTAHPPRAGMSDRMIRHALVRTLAAASWSRTMSPEGVIVGNGVIHLWGAVPDETTRRALVAAAEATEGCRGVVDHMTVEP